jgi:hypothetical protein
MPKKIVWSERAKADFAPSNKPQPYAFSMPWPAWSPLAKAT